MACRRAGIGFYRARSVRPGKATAHGDERVPEARSAGHPAAGPVAQAIVGQCREPELNLRAVADPGADQHVRESGRVIDRHRVGRVVPLGHAGLHHRRARRHRAGRRAETGPVGAEVAVARQRGGNDQGRYKGHEEEPVHGPRLAGTDIAGTRIYAALALAAKPANVGRR